jgi:hypothetical protein
MARKRFQKGQRRSWQTRGSALVTLGADDLIE